MKAFLYARDMIMVTCDIRAEARLDYKLWMKWVSKQTGRMSRSSLDNHKECHKCQGLETRNLWLRYYDIGVNSNIQSQSHKKYPKTSEYDIFLFLSYLVKMLSDEEGVWLGNPLL